MAVPLTGGTKHVLFPSLPRGEQVLWPAQCVQRPEGGHRAGKGRCVLGGGSRTGWQG